MGLFGGGSSASQSNTSYLTQQDNKQVSEVAGSALNLSLSGTHKNNDIIIEDFNEDFATNAIKEFTTATDNTTSSAFEVVNRAFDGFLSFGSEQLSSLNNIASSALKSNNEILARAATTPDERLENIVKPIVVLSILLGGFAIYKGMK